MDRMLVDLLKLRWATAVCMVCLGAAMLMGAMVALLPANAQADRPNPADRVQVLDFHGWRVDDVQGRQPLANPDRGFRLEMRLAQASRGTMDRPLGRGASLAEQFQQFEEHRITLTQGYIYLTAYRDRPLSDQQLQRIAESFDELRQMGMKVVLRAAATDQGDAEDRVLFANPAHDERRRRMTVRSSFDETQNWDNGKLIHRGFSAYSDMVRIEDNQVGLLYEGGEEHAYEQIRFARFTTAWLDDPTVLQIDFTDHRPGMALPSDNNAVRDTRGNGLHGTAENAPTLVEGDPASLDTGPAAHFNGHNQLIRIPDRNHHILDFEEGESFTLEVIIRTTAHTAGGANSSGPIISKDVGPNRPSYWLRIEQGRPRFFVSDGSRQAGVHADHFICDDTWYHIAAVRDAEQGMLLLYVDGELVGKATDATTGSLRNNNDILIGAFNASGDGVKRFQGDIDVIRISHTALTSDTFIRDSATKAR